MYNSYQNETYYYVMCVRRTQNTDTEFDAVPLEGGQV